MEFHMDDTAAQASKDTLVEMSFYVPPTSAEWGVEPDPEDPDHTGAKRLADAITDVADIDDATGEAIAEFESVSLIAPRGKVTIELHAGFMRLTGAAADFKIQYTSIQRLFLLDKPNVPQTYAVMHLDPPIRKGQTFYPHIVAVFNANEELEIETNADEETRAKFPKLEASYDGPSAGVFIRILKAVAGCKLTTSANCQFEAAGAGGGRPSRRPTRLRWAISSPSTNHSSTSRNPPCSSPTRTWTRWSLNATGPHAAATQRTFDIVVSTKGGQDHTFHGIPKEEFQNLVNFLTAKQLRITNVDAQARADRLIDDDDDDEDHHAARLKASARAMDEDGHGGSDSEEDEDFAAGSDDESDGGEPTDESESESGSGDESDEDAPAKSAPRSPSPRRRVRRGRGRRRRIPTRPSAAQLVHDLRGREPRQVRGGEPGSVHRRCREGARGQVEGDVRRGQGAVRREGERGQGGVREGDGGVQSVQGGEDDDGDDSN